MGKRWEKAERGMNFFFASSDRVRMTFDILAYLDSKGANGVTYSTLKQDHAQHRREFITDVLIPNGYARRQERYRRQVRKDNGNQYYQRIVKYYITPEGEDFMLDLENKYKEHKMKALYGRIL